MHYAYMFASVPTAESGLGEDLSDGEEFVELPASTGSLSDAAEELVAPSEDAEEELVEAAKDTVDESEEELVEVLQPSVGN
jgi:hypothetical protein